jgi:hypothetical protein
MTFVDDNASMRFILQLLIMGSMYEIFLRAKLLLKLRVQVHSTIYVNICAMTLNFQNIVFLVFRQRYKYNIIHWLPSCQQIRYWVGKCQLLLHVWGTGRQREAREAREARDTEMCVA